MKNTIVLLPKNNSDLSAACVKYIIESINMNMIE